VVPGDAIMVWNIIEQNYGIIKTTETYVSLVQKLTNISKLKNETIKTYVARIDKIIMDLESLGEQISLRHRKYYILEGLCGLDEWKLDVALIRKLDEDGNWGKEKLHQHLISEENRKILTTPVKTQNTDTTTDTSLNTKHKNINTNTTPCKFHMNRGCKKGNNCNFSHNNNNNNSNNNKNGNNYNKNNNECFNFKQYGSCRYGNNCKYSHSSQEQDSMTFFATDELTWDRNDYQF